ncbi:MAG: chromosome segregation protein SMC [Methylophilaceae bacterium]|nr:chromosome segregation protein SMC [Methylophilaceae bacterium]
MRLIHLKLAGFKSFVDPTTLHLRGQRVGIVGPNGCGKSNIIEAVRWVLGESSARELRGDSMQDVIFNGTATRKPVSRASVELHFDNSLGGASGQWAHYAEIAVKRVIERNGQSSYYINSVQVRRRDVLDLFLGTGVGSRAYGIIGQNTISRIVEAKPEELRIFLEEAAGVSKYKERRHETELRLEDARKNLQRVEDIRNELAKQIIQLESQAEIATQYRQLKQQLDTTQQLLWLMKKRQAAEDWDKSKKRVETLAIALEAKMATLRKSETTLEQVRLQQSEAMLHVQQAQAAFYEASAALSSAEQQLKHARDEVGRNETRLEALMARQARLERQRAEYASVLASQKQLVSEAEARAAALQMQLDQSRAVIPQRDGQLLDAQRALSAAEAERIRCEHAVQLAMANLQHQRRHLDQQHLKRQQLEREKASIVLPDASEIQRKEHQVAQLAQQLAIIEQEMAALQAQEAALQRSCHETQQAVHEGAREIAQAEAKLSTLRKIQQAVADTKLDEWLSKQGLRQSLRLWQLVRAHPGWETALESVLGKRLNALVMDDSVGSVRLENPPAPVVLCMAATAEAAVPLRHDWVPLARKVALLSANVSAIIQDWLAGVYIAESHDEALAKRNALAPGELLVCPRGHIVSRTSVQLYAPSSVLDGILERQRELDMLMMELPLMRDRQGTHEADLQVHQQRLDAVRTKLEAQRRQHKQFADQYQQLMLETQTLRQQRRHAEERLERIDGELKELARIIDQEEHRLKNAEQALESEQVKLPALEEACNAHRAKLGACQTALTQASEVMRSYERQVQEAQFHLRELNNKIIEIDNYIKVSLEEKSEVDRQVEEVQMSLAGQPLAALQAAVHAAVGLRQQREAEMAAARDRLEEIERRLVEVDRQRMQIEHELHPLRDRLEQARLQEQEARLAFEYCDQALKDADESALLAMLDRSIEPHELEHRIAQLRQTMDRLGAVNLAAIDQLEAARERARHLDSQAEDLNVAIATLEEAIRRIDRETRERLQHTYDAVNRNFSELFATLFDGGQARLELLGEEILDSGVQVFAQPPGKRNSTIHLLSGGEKAMTALALVFAIFRLNPAPFCLMDEVDAPLDDSNTERFCAMVRKMSQHIQFVFVTHNKIAMEMAQQLIGVTMQESGVSRIVEVDVEEALRMVEEIA